MFNSLITLIEDRPVLWDKTLDIYKDKRRTFEAWREIFIILKENFEEMTSADKNEYGKSIMKNWSTLRDRWMKCHKRLKEQKSGSGTKNVRKCEYYDQMLFLTKIANPRETVSSMQTATEKSPIRSEPVPKRKKEEDTSEIDRHMANFIKTANKEEESRAMGFFKGIASIVDTFNDDEMIDFQYEVIKLVRTMKHKKNTNQRQSTETEKTDFTEFDERCYTTPSSSFAPSETPEPSFATRPGCFTKTSTFSDTENSPIYTDLSTSSHGNTYTDEFDFDFSREYPQNEDESH